VSGALFHPAIPGTPGTSETQCTNFGNLVNCHTVTTPPTPGTPAWSENVVVGTRVPGAVTGNGHTDDLACVTKLFHSCRLLIPAGVPRIEGGRLLRARVKGRTETRCCGCRSKRPICSARASFSRSTACSREPRLTASRTRSRAAHPLLRMLFPNQIPTTEEIGRAILNAVGTARDAGPRKRGISGQVQVCGGRETRDCERAPFGGGAYR
jgi:hypothetical protein